MAASGESRETPLELIRRGFEALPEWLARQRDEDLGCVAIELREFVDRSEGVSAEENAERAEEAAEAQDAEGAQRAGNAALGGHGAHSGRNPSISSSCWPAGPRTKSAKACASVGWSLPNTTAIG